MWNISICLLSPQLHTSLALATVCLQVGLRTLVDASPQLHTLNLAWCDLTDEAAAGLWGGCTLLVRISFWQCRKLSDLTITKLVSACPLLKDINVAYCTSLTDASGIALAKHGVTHAQFEGCLFTDDTLYTLAEECKELQQITLDGNETITDLGITAIAAGCHQLAHISLEGCSEVTNLGLQWLAWMVCGNLETINLDGVHDVTSSTLVALCTNHPKLSKLDVTNQSQVTDDAIVKGVSNLNPEQLSSLCVGGVFHLTDKALMILANFVNLSIINGSGCIDFTDDGVNALAEGCRGLTSVTFDGCFLLTDASLVPMATKCRQLAFVSVRDCIEVTNNTVTALAELDLKSIFLSNCREIDDVGIQALASGCTSLEEVKVDGIKFLTDGPLIELSKSNPGITEININGHPKVTDNACTQFCKNQRLQEFRAARCHRITDVTAAALATNPLLNTLELSNCVLLTHNGIVSIAQACHGMGEFIVVGCRCQADTETLVEAACPNVAYNGPFF